MKSLVREWRRYPQPSVKEREDLHRRLQEAFSTSTQIPWTTRIKSTFLDDHLTTSAQDHWNGKDVLTLHKILAFFENKPEDYQRIVLEERVITLNGILLEKHNSSKILPVWNIDWSQVVGWPQSVLFYSSDDWDWTVADIKTIQTSIEQISFQTNAIIHNFDASECERIKIRFLQSYANIEGTINWHLLRNNSFGLHLTSSNHNEWDMIDYFPLSQFFASEANSLGKRKRLE